MKHPGLTDVAACVFDAYGTLFDVNAAVASCHEEIGPQADRLADLWRTKQLQYSWLRSLMGRYAEFWQITGEALDYAMAFFGLSDAKLRARLMDLYFNLAAYPDALPVLPRIRGIGLKTAILSNGSRQMLAGAVDASCLRAHLDAVLSVDEVGVFKPHPSVYRLAEQALALPASRMCFLSSNGWDAHAAADFGFRSVWINRTGAPRERIPGDLVTEIRNLNDLPALLGL